MSIIYVKTRDGEFVPVNTCINSGADPGGNYVLTDADKEEIAAIAAEMVEIPGSGGMSATASALLITILRNGVYNTNQSANITALEAALASGGSDEPDVPVDPEKTLTSISATYSGGNVPVGTSVLALTGVVVTAHYSDGSTATVTGYTLSGTIAEGSNTVTVSYGGKTTTFTVTGVAESGGDDGGETSEILYELPSTTTFDGTNSITTEAMLSDSDKDYSIVTEFSVDSANLGKGKLIDAYKGSTMVGTTISVGKQSGYNKVKVMCNNKTVSSQSAFLGEGSNTVKLVVVRTASDNKVIMNAKVNGVRDNGDSGIGLVSATANGAHTYVVKIGTDGFVGIVNELKIYNRVLTDEEIEAYLA